MTSPYENENFISGIYNYCDRWCERCQFTGRCRVYAKEQESNVDSDDIESVVRELTGIFAETKQMLIEAAEERGIDPFAMSDEEFAAIRQREKEFVEADELSQLGDRYWRSAKEILDDKSLYEQEPLADALSVLCQYLFFIPVNIKSGLHALLDEDGFEDKTQLSDSQSYANGTAKIALITIERSLLAWKELADHGESDRVVPLIDLLETIRIKLEARFPLARDFIRPGFDEIEMVM